jgi:hypothetical protein
LTLTRRLQNGRKCSTIKYCSTICQRLAWKEHKLECAHRKSISDEAELDITEAGQRLERRLIQENLIDKTAYYEDQRKVLLAKDDAALLAKFRVKYVRRMLDYCTDVKLKKIIPKYYEANVFRRAVANMVMNDPNADINFQDLKKVMDRRY